MAVRTKDVKERVQTLWGAQTFSQFAILNRNNKQLKEAEGGKAPLKGEKKYMSDQRLRPKRSWSGCSHSLRLGATMGVSIKKL